MYDGLFVDVVFIWICEAPLQSQTLQVRAGSEESVNASAQDQCLLWRQGVPQLQKVVCASEIEVDKRE